MLRFQETRPLAQQNTCSRYYSLGSTAYAMLDYGTVANLAVTTHNTSVSAGASATFASTAIIFIQYVRLRATPPSGVMPTVTIGAINTINAANLTSPPAPTLNPITPNPSTNGTILLSSTAVPGAASYNLYRSASLVTAINGSVTSLGSTGSISATNTVLTNGTYYYVVTAVNASGESNISNCQSVLVVIPPNLSLIQHSPIAINGNAALAAFCAGNGTDGSHSNPYVIQDYVINATTANGIDVENTNAYLVIQNCVVENGSSTYNSGIYLMNATNVEVLYNTISDDWEGNLVAWSKQQHKYWQPCHIERWQWD